MFEPPGSRRDAASTIFNVPDYRVIDAFDLDGGGRRVVVEAPSPPSVRRAGWSPRGSTPGAFSGSVMSR